MVVYTSEISLIFKENKKEKKNLDLRFLLLFWPLKLCDFTGQNLHCSMILWGKVSRLCDFAGQKMQASWFCVAKYAFLCNFTAQSLHCSLYLRGLVSSTNQQQTLSKLIFPISFLTYFGESLLFHRSIAPRKTPLSWGGPI